tara:strand:- start:2799 stop:4967 length:2169 start_codon:yes stop_codon:yes gene_type:complete
MVKTKILCTLGPKSLKSEVIKKLDMRGVSLFRINLSHTNLEELESYIKIIQKNSKTPICIDTEGAQVRNLNMDPKTFYEIGNKVKITNKNIIGNNRLLPIKPPEALNQLKEGTIITVDFDGAMMMVNKINKENIEANVINSGYVTDNRAITFFPFVTLPPISERDKQAIKIAKKYNINTFALSFTNTANDVKYLRKLVGKKATIISKIETIQGVKNLTSINHEVDAILIDRGDLSREVPLENIPFLQKKIIDKTKAIDKPVYVATNLLESMLINKKPTRAEINDVINTLSDGASGLVLAAETAIGNNPVQAVDILISLIKCYRYSIDGYRINDLIKPNSILLPNFHGTGTSNFSFKDNQEILDKDLVHLSSIDIDIEEAMDAKQILSGAYSPLDGFMNEDDLNAVLDKYSLSNGIPWTLPILLQRRKGEKKSFTSGQTVILRESSTKNKIALLHINQCYEIDLERVSKKYFGTYDIKHPGVKKFKEKGNFIISGKLEKISQIKYDSSVLSPRNTRMIFTIKGWTNVIGFHTRNVPHKGHEYIMRTALERENADGLLMHPIIGPKKKGDFKSDVILNAYDALLKDKFNNKALLAGFPTYSRYAGPREAVFTAICRKNYGCRYFIVGRDHTGVGTFYKNNTIEEIFDTIGDIGLKIIFFDEVGYSKKNNRYLEINNKKDTDFQSLKGTDVRNLLLSKKKIPKWLISSSVYKTLIDRKKNDLFVK